ncbi:MAG: hypothetical protein H7X77_10780 [Anaerolineae bacterium]|nr:hypothetical protein [Anaerolineae bacterium]
MKLFCPECGEAIPAEKINVFALVAVCPACNHLFSFSKPDIRDIYKNKKIILPRKLEVYENDDVVVMSYRWFRRFEIIFIALSVLCWNGMLLTMTIHFILAYGGLVLLFMILPAGIGLFMLYWLSILAFNRIEISLFPDRIQIYYGPVFVPGSLTVPTEQVEQIYCKYRSSHQIRGNGFSFNPSRNRLYELHAVLLDGRDMLIYGTDEEEFARFIGQRIRYYIGLDGELPFQDATGKAFTPTNF